MNKIAENKVKYLLIIEKDVKEELEKIAQSDERSLNNLINKVLKDFLKSKKD